MRNTIRQGSTGSNINNLSNSIGYIKIPLPPLEIQEKIVAKCLEVDNEYNTSRMAIEEYRKKILQVFENLQVITGGVN